MLIFSTFHFWIAIVVFLYSVRSHRQLMRCRRRCSWVMTNWDEMRNKIHWFEAEVVRLFVRLFLAAAGAARKNKLNDTTWHKTVILKSCGRITFSATFTCRFADTRELLDSFQATEKTKKEWKRKTVKPATKRKRIFQRLITTLCAIFALRRSERWNFANFF